MSDADIERLPREIQERGVDVGAAVILETADGKILLTRRAHHLRTFPGIWVPPGKLVYFIVRYRLDQGLPY